MPPFVRPDVAAFLQYVNAAAAPKTHEIGAAAARQLMRATRDLVDVETGPLARCEDIAMPAPHGGTIRLRLFDPAPERAPGPVIVFFHGGGWVLGDLDTYEPACAAIARGLDLPLVSVDYRLAPEHPWPAAPEDCEAAARWVASAPAALGLSPTALVLAGDSAGGTLAITTAIALRDEPAALPVLAHWPIYPAADLATHYPSYSEYGTDFLLSEESMRWFIESYAPDVSDWRGSPMRAKLDGLPPALVTTAGLDPLRDQGRAYAGALVKAGVPTIFREARGQVHGYINMRRAIPSSIRDLDGALAALRTIITEEQGR